MNKLLSILAEQTFYCGNLEGDVYTGQLDLERFAQLIVAECVAICQDIDVKITLMLGRVDRIVLWRLKNISELKNE